MGLAQVGGHGIGLNFSGDIILALSTANKPDEKVLTPQINGIGPVEVNQIEIINESEDGMFRAAPEVTEEAILDSTIAGREDGLSGVEITGLASG